jgi:hypothetical protein
MLKRHRATLENASPQKGEGSRNPLLLWIILAVLIGLAPIAYRRGHSGPLCYRRLHQISNGLLLYAIDHHGKFPDNLSGLIEESLPPSALVCPNSSDTPAKVGPTTQATIANVNAGGHMSYIYLGKGRSNNLPADFVLVYEPLANHSNVGMNVLFGDLHLQFLTRREATWMLSEIDSGHNPPRPDPSTQPATRSSGGGYSSTP